MIFFFFFNDTATTEIYTLSLHDALPISGCVVDPFHLAKWYVARSVHGRSLARSPRAARRPHAEPDLCENLGCRVAEDRKSTRLNSSHANISYAVFCLKKKKKKVTRNVYA